MAVVNLRKDMAAKWLEWHHRNCDSRERCCRIATQCSVAVNFTGPHSPALALDGWLSKNRSWTFLGSEHGAYAARFVETWVMEADTTV